MQVRRNGPKVIDAMVGKFKGIISGLDQGIQLCDAKEESNSTKIGKLEEHNTFLGQKRKQAKVFRDNLHAMLNEERVEAPEGFEEEIEQVIEDMDKEMAEEESQEEKKEEN